MKELLTKRKWEGLFPFRHELYTYEGLEEASRQYFPLFLSEGNATTRKIELAAFLAQTAHESGDYTYAYEPHPKSNYCSAGAGCYGVYMGRGPIQLTRNINYERFSMELLGTDEFLRYPDRLLDNSTIIWVPALWYWMTHHDGHETIHDMFVKRGLDAFPYSTYIINGAIECGTTRCHPYERRRVRNFLKFTETLDIGPGTPEQLSCQTNDYDTEPYRFRCGKNMFHANTTCGQECYVHSCPEGEYCYKDVAPCEGTTDEIEPSKRNPCRRNYNEQRHYPFSFIINVFPFSALLISLFGQKIFHKFRHRFRRKCQPKNVTLTV